jgi:hypothetical protein
MLASGSRGVDFTGTTQLVGGTVNIKALASVSASDTLLSSEAYVVFPGPIETPDGTQSTIRVAGAAIRQSSGSVQLRGGVNLNLVANGAGSGSIAGPASIVMNASDNKFSQGSITAVAGANAVGAPTPTSKTGGAYQVSVVTINGGAEPINIGNAGTVTLASYSSSGAGLSQGVGVYADWVRLSGNSVKTGSNFIIANYGVNMLYGSMQSQAPGLVLNLKSGATPGSFGSATGGPQSSGIGNGLYAAIGYNAAQSELQSNGYVLIVPNTYSDSFSDGLASLRSLGAYVALNGPVELKNSYAVFAPGLEVTVPVYYNGQTPVQSFLVESLASIVALQEKVRRDKYEEAVSTENVARDLRDRVIVEVGLGRSATIGYEGIKRPSVCVPGEKSMQCSN